MNRTDTRKLTVQAKMLREDIKAGNGRVNWSTGVWYADLNKQNHARIYAATINRVHWHSVPSVAARRTAIDLTRAANNSNLWGVE